MSAAEYSEILLAKRTSVNEDDQTRLETREKKGIILRAWKIGDRDLLEVQEEKFEVLVYKTKHHLFQRYNLVMD